MKSTLTSSGVIQGTGVAPHNNTGVQQGRVLVPQRVDLAPHGTGMFQPGSGSDMEGRYNEQMDFDDIPDEDLLLMTDDDILAPPGEYRTHEVSCDTSCVMVYVSLNV